MSMKFFKNFVTKKQLRQENERLKLMMNMNKVHIFERKRNVQTIKSTFHIGYHERDIPEEIIKQEISRNMIKYLQPFISYDFKDDGNGGKIYEGTLHILE